MVDSELTNKLLRQAIAAAKDGDKEDAKALFLKVTELDDRNVMAWLWLSGLVTSFSERRICLENVLTVDPQNSKALAGLRWLDEYAPAQSSDLCPHCGTNLPPSGKTCPACERLVIVHCPSCEAFVDVDESACSDCGETLGDFREGARYYLRLAEVYRQHEHLNFAEEILPFAEVEALDDAKLLMEIAAQYKQLNQSERMIRLYERVIELGVADAALYIRLGQFYESQGAFDEAQTAYEQALQFAGDDVGALFALARYYLEKDAESQQAIELLERATHLAPKNPKVLMLLARAYGTCERHSEAVTALEKAVKLTSVESAIGRTARYELGQLRPVSSQLQDLGWGTTFRMMMGLLLPLLLTLLVNAQFSLLNVRFIAWPALILAIIGAYLWVSATDVPQNPGMRLLFGKNGIQSSAQRWVLGFSGILLWLLAFAALLAKL